MEYLWAAAAVVLAALIIAGDNVFSVTRYDIKTNKLKERKRLLLISDIHSKRVSGRLFGIIDKFRPDIILIAGDLWDRKKGRVEAGVKLVSQMANRAEVVYTPGNHDYSYPERERMFAALADAGAHVLRADEEELCGLRVAGFDRLGYGIFADALLKNKKDGFRALVTHYPQYFHDEYSCCDVDLVLCGHAHGGQFRIPFLNRGLYSPGQGIFPKYSEGMHVERGVAMIVSRGIGNSNRFPFRLFNPPEAVVIDILPEERT